METPPPPSQQQADAAQRARRAAEDAIFDLFSSIGQGQGSERNEPSVLQAVKIAAILSTLSAAIVVASFGNPSGRSESLLTDQPDHERIGDAILPNAQIAFARLYDSDLDDRQRSILWATWAYSKTADKIATSIDSGEVPHEFSGKSLNKVWISRSDAKVRPMHVKLHGKTVRIETDFWRWPDTGQRLRWPGDEEAPPEAVIGCRCVCLLSWSSQDEVSETIRSIVEHTKKS